MVEHRTTIHLPPIREMLGRAGRPLLEFTLVPLALFWVLLSEVGFDAGLIAGLGWAGLAIARRLLVGQKLPTILLITTTLLVVRTAVGLETGSAFLYFLQPTVQNFVFALMLLVTIGLDRPLLAKLADDFCALPKGISGHPGIKRFFRHVSLLWALVFLINGVTTIVVLATQTVGNFLLVSTAGSYSVVAMGIALSVWWFRRALAGNGIHLRIGPPAAI